LNELADIQTIWQGDDDCGAPTYKLQKFTKNTENAEIGHNTTKMHKSGTTPENHQKQQNTGIS